MEIVASLSRQREIQKEMTSDFSKISTLTFCMTELQGILRYNHGWRHASSEIYQTWESQGQRHRRVHQWRRLSRYLRIIKLRVAFILNAINLWYFRNECCCTSSREDGYLSRMQGILYQGRLPRHGGWWKTYRGSYMVVCVLHHSQGMHYRINNIAWLFVY